MTGLVLAPPGGDHMHDDEDCGRAAGDWPLLRMSPRAAESRGLDDCPDCRGGGRPGFGVDPGVGDLGTGARVEAETSAQRFAGTVARRYVSPEPGVAHRAVCDSDRGYEFVIEELESGRTRLEKPSNAVTFNVLELEAGP